MPIKLVTQANLTDCGLACVAMVTGKSLDAVLRVAIMECGYLLLYARIKGTVYLLSIRHQRQLSFDFLNLWPI